MTAVLLAVLLPTSSAPAAPAKALPQALVLAAASAPASASASGFGATANPGSVSAAAFSDGGGPACGPGAPDHDGLPAVPARAQGEHGQVPAGRPVPEEGKPQGAMPVRAVVRGPDRPAPGPVELSVMRV
ncbi:hypothetical protein [Streptomyces sp. NPDC054849]